MKVSFVCLSRIFVDLCRRNDIHPSGLSESKAQTSSSGKEIDNVICLDKRHLISDCRYGNIRRFITDMQEKTGLVIICKLKWMALISNRRQFGGEMDSPKLRQVNCSCKADIVYIILKGG